MADDRGDLTHAKRDLDIPPHTLTLGKKPATDRQLPMAKEAELAIQMRRVASYGGPSGVPASQRLKHKLAETAGMRVFSDRLSQEQGFLAPLAEDQDGRVIHSTSWATRNFFATASSLKKFVKGSKFWGSTSREPVVFAEEDTAHGNGLPHTADISGDDAPQLETSSSSLQGAESDHSGAAVQGIIPQAESLDSQGNAGANYGDVRISRTNHKRSASDPANLSLPTLSTNWNVFVQPNDDPTYLDSVDGQRQGHHNVSYQGVDAGIQRAAADPEPHIFIGRQESISFVEAGIAPFVGSELHESARALAPDGNCISQGDPYIVQTTAPEFFFVEHGSPEAPELTLDLRSAAALKIQCHYRQWSAQKQYLFLRDKTRKMQAIYRGKRASDEYQSLRSKVIVCQRVWRRHRSFQMHLRALAAEAARMQSIRQKSATLIQSYWRAHAQKLALLKHLEMQRAKNEAAHIIQRRWRRFQQISLEEYSSVTRARAAVVIQAFVRGWLVRNVHVIQNRSATIIQREWRAYRHQVSSAAALKMQTWWRRCKQQRLDRAYYKKCQFAAIRLQCMWRAWIARQLLQHLQMERTVKEKAATRLQAYTRGHSVRQSVLKQRSAAKMIQRCWHNHWLKECHHAAVVIQSRWRGYVSRKNAPFVHCLGVPDDKQDDVADAKYISPVLVVTGSLDTQSQEVSLLRVSTGTNIDCEQELLIQGIDVSRQEGMPTQCDKIQGNGNIDEGMVHSVWSEDISVSKPSVSQPSFPIRNNLLVERSESLSDGFVPEPAFGLSIIVRDEVVEACTNGDHMFSCHAASGHEDWNDVQIDDLDECLDTCLAALTPVPTISSIDLDEKITQNADALRATDCRDKLVSALDVCEQDIHAGHSFSSCAAASEASQPGVLRGVSGDLEDLPSGNMREPEGAIRSFGHEAGTKYQKHPNKHQLKLHQLKLHQNEERLQHFARVFLLQRQIAHQQFRAQSAPPFPPPHQGMLVPSFDGQMVHDNGTTTNSKESSADHLGVKDPHSPRDLDHTVSQVAPSDPVVLAGTGLVNGTTRLASVRPNGVELPLVTGQSVQARTAGSDVVVNMAELLKQLDGVYGASKPHPEYLTSPVLLSRETVLYIGDDEDTYDKQGKSAFGFRRDSSLLTDVVGTKRLGMPDVNAMLVILVAMVVYTRTIFRSSFMWARESQRK